MYPETTIAAVFFNRAAQHPDKNCVYSKVDNSWQPITWQQMATHVKACAAHLKKIGVQRGDRVAIFAGNRWEWWVSDLASLAIGAISVPIYATNTADEAAYIIHDSGSKVCFAGDKGQVKRVRQLDIGLISYDKVEGTTHFGDILSEEADLDSDIRATTEEELATLIYTSGTTGNPKGVMLTHKNIFTNVLQVHKHYDWVWATPQVTLSFLPLSHAFGRTVDYYLAIYASTEVYFAESFAAVAENLKECRPTLLVSVPRLYEKIHAGINTSVASAPLSKKLLFRWARSCMRRNLKNFCEKENPKGLFGLEFRLAEKLVLSKLRAAIGLDRNMTCISGGGPLSKNDNEFFLGLGINLLEGYGLSETSPIISSNPHKHIKAGTVGLPYFDTELRISSEGELQIKGPQVMRGYYKNEVATREAFTADGWLKTGDLGLIDDEGYLKITGRIKDIIITAGGKNISPQNIENSLKTSTYISQVCVIGDQRKFLTCLIVPDFDELNNWIAQQGLNFASTKEAINSPQVRELIQQELDNFTIQFSRVERIKKFALLEQDWSQESGELTPSLKIKRHVINEKFAGVIDALYE